MDLRFGLYGIQGGFEELVAGAQRAEAVGFDSVLFGEHHGSKGFQHPALLNLLAGLAARTDTVRLGTSVLLSPLYNPVRIAEEAAQVDVMSKGRLILGLGMGYQPRDFTHFGVPFRNRVSLFEEGIEVIRRAWTERPFTFVGRRYAFASVSVFPAPVQRPHPPIWLAGMSMAGVGRAARLGDAWVTDPIQDRSSTLTMASCYLERRRALGADPCTVLMREILIGRTRAAALEEYGPGIV
ncbi:MAG TPA: LLM class flavin-dependent oxidoreductase [Chloroflexota bacterium]|jgi:probable F420-dependent oxidoreductase